MILSEIDHDNLYDEFKLTRDNIFLKLNNKLITKQEALSEANNLKVNFETQINLAGLTLHEKPMFISLVSAVKLLIYDIAKNY